MGRADVLMEACQVKKKEKKKACGHFGDDLEFGMCDRMGRGDFETSLDPVF